MFSFCAENDETVNWESANFQTHCWYLALHAHHLAIMPAIQRYNKRLRAIKELRRMVEDLTNTEPQWRNTPSWPQKKELLTRWTYQLKRLTK